MGLLASDTAHMVFDGARVPRANLVGEEGGGFSAALSILNFQIMGALVDVKEDAAVGKRTFAVAFGPTVSMAAVIASLLVKAGLTYVFTGHRLATAVVLVGAVLVAAGFSLGRVSRRSSAYNSFIILDWIWLALMFLR